MRIIQHLIVIIPVVLFFTSCKEKQGAFTAQTASLPFRTAANTATKIDSLNDEKSIETFIRALKYPQYKVKLKGKPVVTEYLLDTFKLKTIAEFDRGFVRDSDSLSKLLAQDLKIDRSFFKKDFDNNGFTDLLVIGDNQKCSSIKGGFEESKFCDYSIYAFMNFGNDSIHPILVNDGTFHTSMVPRIMDSNNGPLLEVFETSIYDIPLAPNLHYIARDTLAHAFDAFIAYNPTPKDFAISKILYATEGCFGTCPIFELSIDNKRNGHLNAKHYNRANTNIFEHEISEEIMGNCYAKITQDKFDEIVALLNYLDFPQLENGYSETATDLSGCLLTVHYDNGKIKTIGDYGKSGTPGLMRLYEMLHDLRINQDWQ